MDSSTGDFPQPGQAMSSCLGKSGLPDEIGRSEPERSEQEKPEYGTLQHGQVMHYDARHQKLSVWWTGLVGCEIWDYTPGET
jgi:hypothetical protein